MGGFYLNGILSIVYALLVFSVLIIVHELGHFLAARWAGVTVHEFAIGMGPAIYKKQGKHTLFALRALPIGGFVKMEGEDEESQESGSFNTKPVWERFIVLSAGALMNIVLGFVLSAVMVISAPAIASNTVAKFDEGALSATTGLQAGDTILKVNNSNINVSTDVAFTLLRTGGEPVELTVLRDGKKVVLSGVQFPSETEQGQTYSYVDFYFLREAKTVFSVARQSFFKCISVTRAIWGSLLDLFTGQVGMDQLSGPVGTTVAIGNAAAAGWDSLLFFMIFISVNLGIVNLLPLPALDGGRLLFLLIEAVRRKPLKAEYEGYIHFAGFVLLMLLLVFVTFNDIIRLNVQNLFK